jgi:hypothetical protein
MSLHFGSNVSYYFIENPSRASLQVRHFFSKKNSCTGVWVPIPRAHIINFNNLDTILLHNVYNKVLVSSGYHFFLKYFEHVMVYIMLASSFIMMGFSSHCRKKSLEQSPIWLNLLISYECTLKKGSWRYSNKRYKYYISLCYQQTLNLCMTQKPKPVRGFFCKKMWALVGRHERDFL